MPPFVPAAAFTDRPQFFVQAAIEIGCPRFAQA